jgi:DNA-binding MarR family transcriptional regulator
MQNRLSIKSIQAFEAAARLGSFAAAAEELAVTPSAVSHQIKLLEDQLGVTLFHRVHRAVVLTEAGRHLATEVIAAFARIEAATRHTAVAGMSAVLTVHSTPSFASQWLMRRLTRFGAGKLIVPFAGDVMTAQGHGFVTPRSKTDLPKISSFREWLFDELAKTHAWANQFFATGMATP